MSLTGVTQSAYLDQYQKALIHSYINTVIEQQLEAISIYMIEYMTGHDKLTNLCQSIVTEQLLPATNIETDPIEETAVTLQGHMNQTILNTYVFGPDLVVGDLIEYDIVQEKITFKSQFVRQWLIADEQRDLRSYLNESEDTILGTVGFRLKGTVILYGKQIADEDNTASIKTVQYIMRCQYNDNIETIVTTQTIIYNNESYTPMSFDFQLPWQDLTVDGNYTIRISALELDSTGVSMPIDLTSLMAHNASLIQIQMEYALLDQYIFN